MPRRFFELLDDVYVPNRWHLGVPLDERGQKVWTWLFRQGKPAEFEGQLRIPLSRPGEPMDFSIAGAAVPVVHTRVATALAELAPRDIQLIPVSVEALAGRYFILNVLRTVKCIDDAACEEVQRWTEEDGQLERVGEYRAVSGLRIDPSKVGDTQLFRPWGWPVALIVAEQIKEASERIGATGMKFKEVTGPSAIHQEEHARDQKFRELWQQADAAREATWRTLGQLEEESLVPIAVGGGWPSRRQAWRIIHRAGGRTLLVTDGLSDPFHGQTELSVGFGLELALETDEPVQDVAKSQALQLLERVADEVAEHEHVRERLKAGLFSMEVSGEGMSQALITSEGRVGVLLGVESRSLPRGFMTPAGEVRLVTVKALFPAELSYLLERGRQGQVELARRFVKDGQEHLSSSSRKPVV